MSKEKKDKEQNNSLVGTYESEELHKRLSSPLGGLSEIDKGDEMQRRIRYQHTCTAYIALLMYTEKLSFEEILCEQQEDILGVCKNQKFYGIQIKTRQLSDGPFKLNDAAVKASIKRFVELDLKFPKQFERFVFISNCEYLRDETGNSIDTLMKQIIILEERGFVFKPRTLEDYIKGVEKECSTDRIKVLDVLRRIEFQTMPGLDEIDSKIITETLSKIEICNDLNVAKLNHILKMLKYTIYEASSKFIDDPIRDYIALFKGDKLIKITEAEVNAKRITKQMIKSIIENVSTKAYYLASNDSEFLLSPDRKMKMEKKMNCGLIDPEIISVMELLRQKAEEYYLGSYYSSSEENLVRKELEHILNIIQNQAIEAKVRSKEKGSQYGPIMMRDIEDRLNEICKTRHKDVNNCPYEILKGLVGLLTGECKIAFSEVPEGGWDVD